MCIRDRSGVGGKTDPRGDVLMKDAIFLFRALCKLAMKPLVEGVSIDSVSMRMKILSLELLDGVLKAAGPVFKSSDRCIFAIRQYLCMSLVQNSVSAVPAIFRLIIKIFETLLHKFKQNLKPEVGIFFSSVLLRTLETDNSSFPMKILVLETISDFVKHSRNLVELFVNYDCDLEFDDLYEALVNVLSRIAQGVHVKNLGLQEPQEQQLMMHAIASLVKISTSMAGWVDNMLDAKTSMEAEAEEAEEAEELSDGEDGATTAAEVAHNEAEKFDLDRKNKQLVVKGLNQFADSPSGGVKYFIKEGFCEASPQSVAKFLHEFKGLSKKSIGEYLGRSKEFNKQVLHEFTALFDFSVCSYDKALRSYLNAFRLPGEACMIDPIMEKFAESYFKDGPESKQFFKNADAAYVLSYSIMMLNTDLHHPEIKDECRMTIAQFRRNLGGVNDGEDLDPGLLEGIYHSIQNDEIKLKDDDISFYNLESGNQTNTNMDPKMRAEKWKQESANAVEKMNRTVKSAVSATYQTATHYAHVRPMFEVSRWPFLSGFSQYLEQTVEQSVCNLCLEGFKAAIHIACIFYMDTERDAFITSLSKFTQLATLRDMNGKNVLVINTLLRIAVTEANYLQSTWNQVLTCISQVERLRLISTGVQDESHYFGGNSRPKTAKAPAKNPDEEKNAIFLAPADSKEDALRIMSEINEAYIEAIFINSQHYTSECIVDFVNELCVVALGEIHNPKEPRIFTSQKVVEVAIYNMDRIRIVFSKIWQLMSQHFFRAGCHPNSHLSMYAIDSLRQLAIQFLSKDELESFSFQKDFLTPFKLILQNNTSEDAHELVIRCVQQIVQAKSAQLKSGWETVMQVLGHTAIDSFSTMCALGFEVLEGLMKDYFQGFAEFLQPLVVCLTSFASNPHETAVAGKAVKHLKGLCDRLSEGAVPSCCPGQDGRFSFSEGHGKGWCTVLSSFGTIAWDPRASIGAQGIDSLFGLLTDYGGLWDIDMWQMVLKQVVFEMVDGAKGTKDVAEEEKARLDWISKSCVSAVTRLIDVFDHLLDKLTPLWEDLVMYMYGLVAQPDLELALVGMKMLEAMVNSLGAKLSNEMWDILLKVVGLIFETSTPREFVDAAVLSAAADQQLVDMTATPKGSPDDGECDLVLDSAIEERLADNPWKPPTAIQFEAMRLMCTVQLLLIKVTGKIYATHSQELLSRHVLVLVECLEGACRFAHEFNMNRGARTKLWNPELIKDMPDLIAQETSALTVSATARVVQGSL
eukprot:TRINITY_DN7736_c0_g1_i1.p1 TRINITY_DN7736_c0_g1~~TRINITY_DN7736_c0_g1_i1.p1  ORF type:complete len:1266 (-),score=430.69 TRINITY_DN7736_c0_g1_i1:413-4183(-)